MAIKKTPRAIIEVLDSEGKVTGYEIENFYIYEAEGPDDPMVRVAKPQVVRDPASQAEVDALRGTSSDGLTAENEALRAENTRLQQVADDATARAEAAVADATRERDAAVAAETEMRDALDMVSGAIRKVLGR